MISDRFGPGGAGGGRRAPELARGGCWPGGAERDVDKNRAELFAAAGTSAARAAAPGEHSSFSPPSYRSVPATSERGGGRDPGEQQRHAGREEDRGRPCYGGGGNGGAGGGPFGTRADACRDDDFAAVTDEDVDRLKVQSRNTKQQTLQSSRNALRVVTQTEEIAVATMNQLGSQSELLSRIENRMDVSLIHAESAAEKATHLKSLNRSMFLPHFRAPWRGKKRAEQRIAKAEADHLAAQQRKDDLRAQEQGARARVRDAVGGSARGAASGGDAAAPADFSRYQFEPDEKDHAVERELDSNFNDISDAVGRLKNLALGMNAEIDRQNGSIGRISGKVDLTGATIAGSSARLRSIQ